MGLSHDASHYHQVPEVTVSPASVSEVVSLVRACAAAGQHLTFRSGGTSLSGQAVTDGVLVDTRRFFRDIEVLQEGRRIRVQPGVTVAQVNARLAPYGRKLGPDPASEAACTVGGVVADNSSGMACGTARNAYHTIESLVLVLASGTVVDTGLADADDRLRHQEPLLYEGIARLRDRVRADPASVRTVRRQFAMKNTMGYGVNSFLDHSRPVDILAHLVVGSEGTLAFVAEATFRTVAVRPHAAVGLLVFADLASAAGCLPALLDTDPAVVELLDAASLRTAQQDPHADRALRQLGVARHAALLVEYQDATAAALAEHRSSSEAVLAGLPLQSPPVLTGDRAGRDRIWHVRKGLYPAIAAARPSGTTALLEDVVVPVPALAETCERLTDLFGRHGYGASSIIFGHAKDGNLHFMLTERFDGRHGVDRYLRFTDDLVDLILGQGGSLKAEHGTGRMMAPYVRRQYGDELYDVMCQLKGLCDPQAVLSPGVVINADPLAHVRHLKVTPPVEHEVDRCVECGYCEPVCPSRELTTTPRQRIVLRRAIAAATARGERALARELLAAYGYDAVDTCATDGMCQTACPVLINTGDLMKRLRSLEGGAVERATWHAAARHWASATRMAAAALDIAATLPAPAATAASRTARRLLGSRTIPLWTSDLPPGGRPRSRSGGSRSGGTRPAATRAGQAVYFAACLGAIFGPAPPGRGVGHAFGELCARADVPITVPTGIDDLCCGMPWQSKGLTAGHGVMAGRVLPALWEGTRGGAVPVVCDASSCTEGLARLVAQPDPHTTRYRALRIIDVVDFVHREVLPRLPVTSRLPALALHPTCSSVQLGTNGALFAIADAIAAEVAVPPSWGCCGFAGDRGMLLPEVTAAATRRQAEDLGGRTFAGYASCNRTCEIGMSRATGRQYRHIVELVEEATR